MKKLILLCAIVGTAHLHTESWASLEHRINLKIKESFHDSNAQIKQYYEGEIKRLTQPEFCKKNAPQLCNDLKKINSHLWIKFFSLQSTILKYQSAMKKSLEKSSHKTFKQVVDFLEKELNDIVTTVDYTNYKDLQVLSSIMQKTSFFIKQNTHKLIECLHAFDSVVLDDSSCYDIIDLIHNNILEFTQQEQMQKIKSLMQAPQYDLLFTKLAMVLQDPEVAQVVENYIIGRPIHYTNKKIYEDFYNLCYQYTMALIIIFEI